MYQNKCETVGNCVTRACHWDFKNSPCLNELVNFSAIYRKVKSSLFVDMECSLTFISVIMFLFFGFLATNIFQNYHWRQFQQRKSAYKIDRIQMNYSISYLDTPIHQELEFKIKYIICALLFIPSSFAWLTWTRVVGRLEKRPLLWIVVILAEHEPVALALLVVLFKFLAEIFFIFIAGAAYCCKPNSNNNLGTLINTQAIKIAASRYHERKWSSGPEFWYF